MVRVGTMSSVGEVRQVVRRLDAEGADAPPGQPATEGVLADVADGAVRRGAEVDRRGPAAGRGRPAGAEELLAGRDQVVGPAAGALGVEHQDVGVVGHQVDEQLHLVDEHGRERLHALDGDAGRDLVGQLEQLRVPPAELGRPLPDLVGEQQLATRRRPEPLDLLQGALVGDREGADLLDVVAPELHAQRVFLGRREDVDDAAADRELAAPLDQVDAGVRRGREPAYDVLERSRVAGRRARPARGHRVPCTWGWSTERTGATTTFSGPFDASVPGWHSRRSTASRRPTVSLRGLSRSCGSVSQLG